MISSIPVLRRMRMAKGGIISIFIHSELILPRFMSIPLNLNKEGEGNNLKRVNPKNL